MSEYDTPTLETALNQPFKNPYASVTLNGLTSAGDLRQVIMDAWKNLMVETPMSAFQPDEYIVYLPEEFYEELHESDNALSTMQEMQDYLGGEPDTSVHKHDQDDDTPTAYVVASGVEL